jgi:SAM-dependent methyltransferase
MTPIPEFTDPRLVAVYDTVNAYRAGTQPAFYAQLARDVDARLIVDVGCGTGLVTRELAASGCAVIGVDPNPLMLDVARSRVHGGRVHWIDGGATDVGTPHADLAIMAGHVVQFFLGDDEWCDALIALRRALRPGGHLAFESRNPDGREWEQWTRARARVVIDAAAGPIETWTDVQDVRDGIVSCTNHYVFARTGEELTSPVRLRFRTRDELTGSLERAGFAVEHVYGGWDRRHVAPDPTGPELIYISVSDSQPWGGAARRQHCSGAGAARRSWMHQSASSASSWDV